MEAQRIASLKNVAWAIYALLALSYFIPFTGLIGIIIAYVKRPDAEGTFLHFHFTWLINTFWIALIITLIGILTLFIMVGWAVMFGGFVWALYRLIKGGLRLNEDRSPYDF
jgi:uncharacterized membrane protein